jgi:hypothetical protein
MKAGGTYIYHCVLKGYTINVPLCLAPFRTSVHGIVGKSPDVPNLGTV